MPNPIVFNAARLMAVQTALVGDCFPDRTPTDPLVQTTNQIFDGIYGLVRDLAFRKGPARDLFVEDPQKAFLRMAPLDISALGQELIGRRKLHDWSMIRERKGEEEVTASFHNNDTDNELGCQLFIARCMTAQTVPAFIFGVEISWVNRSELGEHRYENSYALRVTRRFFREQLWGPYQERVELQLTHDKIDRCGGGIVDASENKNQATATLSFHRPSVEGKKKTDLKWVDLQISDASYEDTFDGAPYCHGATNRAGNNTLENFAVAWEKSLNCLGIVHKVLWPHVRAALGSKKNIPPAPESDESWDPYEILSPLISQWAALSEFERAKVRREMEAVTRERETRQPPRSDESEGGTPLGGLLAGIVNQPLEETLATLEGASRTLEHYYGEEAARKADESFRPTPPARPPTSGPEGKRRILRIVRSEDPSTDPDKPPKKS